MKNISKNIQEANCALTEKPLFATSAERFLILDSIKSSFKELPQPLRFSKTLSILLSNVSTPIEDHDLIAGRCVDRELTEEEEKQFQKFIDHPDYTSRSTFLSSGHCTYSWDLVVEKGLPGMRDIALEGINSTEDEQKKIFLTSIIEIYDSIAAYMLRYADEADSKGMTDLAQNMRRAATERPDTFASALQLLWIIALIDCAYITENPTLTLGRLDMILYPLYRDDVNNGRLTRDEAKELITDYYCKHNLIMGRGEHQVGDKTNSTTFNRILNFDAPQYLLLAGKDENGDPVTNELTELFAECIEPSFKNPVVVVRYVKDMDKTSPNLWHTLTEKALASSSMMFYNDQNVTATFERIGLPLSDARNYAHFGCNWCSTGDNGAWMAGGPGSDKYNAYLSEEEKKSLNIPYMRWNATHGWPEDFMIVMKELASRDPEDVTIEDFYSLFFARMSSFLDTKLDYLSRELAVRKRKPSAILTFGDCFFRDSLKNAECFSSGAKYHFEIQSFQMFGTVVDCFIAVDQLVLREKKLTLKQLIEATEANFVGYESILALCRGADKYGMDTPLSNEHVKRLSHTASAMVIEKNRPYFEKQKLFVFPCIQSDTWHLKIGELYGATPNGRLANTPFSQNSRPSNGACVNGLTAMLNSMLNLPADGLASGALNLDVDPKQFEGEEGKTIFSALLAVYFNRGGLHAQVTCANVDELIDAQINPQDHRDLRVRVTGYSGIFVDICKRLQDDIIERHK